MGVMHRSRLTALGIDVPVEAHAVSASFWAGALGRSAEPDGDGTYLNLGRVGGLEVFVQRVGEGGPRFSVDIETDDVDAEVERLEGLGATRVEWVSTWWVMRDPAGNLLCVVPPQTNDFPADAATWP
jgi:hypothetical protein